MEISVGAKVLFDGSSVEIQSTTGNSIRAGFICERPQPCYQCPHSWFFFNQHCYKSYKRRTRLSVAREICDADRAYLEYDGRFNEVLVSLLTSDSFLYRK